MKNIIFKMTILYLLFVVGCTNQVSIPSNINNSIKHLNKNGVILIICPRLKCDPIFLIGSAWA